MQNNARTLPIGSAPRPALQEQAYLIRIGGFRQVHIDLPVQALMARCIFLRRSASRRRCSACRMGVTSNAAPTKRVIVPSGSWATRPHQAPGLSAPSIHRFRSAADIAPERRARSWPPTYKTIVGMLRIPCAAPISGWASVSTLAKRTPGIRCAAASNCGAIILHGPHHSAQKSTTTGNSVCPTNPANRSLLSATGLRAIRSAPHRPHTGSSCMRVSGTRLTAPHCAQDSFTDLSRWVGAKR